MSKNEKVHYIGRVLDRKNQAPIKDARISVNSDFFSVVTQTDLEGIFRFTVNSDSKENILGRVIIEAKGYPTYTSQLKLIPNQKDLGDIRLGNPDNSSPVSPPSSFSSSSSPSSFSSSSSSSSSKSSPSSSSSSSSKSPSSSSSSSSSKSPSSSSSPLSSSDVNKLIPLIAAGIFGVFIMILLATSNSSQNNPTNPNDNPRDNSQPSRNYRNGN
ncbi:MAG: hypothetical protein KME64_36375 [Scytonematopsis contorta HA4267-MV1]|nr:hypothetical protein [Scytonematopsis contorta HA4267-MV1]